MIVAMDSGIGGASILKEVMECAFNNEFVYFADTKNSPYGNKTKKEIFDVVKHNVDFLLSRYKIDILILACNTATSVCAKKFRQIYDFPIIGVEPPIKVALDKRRKDVLVIATKQTIKSNLTLKRFIKRKSVKIKLLPLKKLAKLIDQNVFNLENTIPYLEKKIHRKNYDAVVLGCTHYNFVKSELKKVLPCAEIISCEDGVAKYTKKLCASLSEKQHKVEILLSEENETIRSFLEQYLILDFSHSDSHPKTKSN